MEIVVGAIPKFLRAVEMLSGVYPRGEVARQGVRTGPGPVAASGATPGSQRRPQCFPE